MQLVVPLGLRRAFDRGVRSAAWLGYRMLPITYPEWHGVELTSDVPYRNTGHPGHLLDVYRPDVFEKRPAILYAHGGAFSMLSKDTHRLMALALASRGYVVFNINYRLGPRHTYPKPLEDVAAALHYVLEHGSEHGADVSRLAIGGDSAGANLITALGFMATEPRPEPFARAVFDKAPPIRAVLAMYGVHDLEDLQRLYRHPRKARRMPAVVKQELAWVARAYLGERPRPAPLASPLRMLEAQPSPEARPLPAFFATVGTADPLLDDSRRLDRAVRARGGESELHVFPGEIHGFNAMLWRPAARKKWEALFAFLDRHLPVRSEAVLHSPAAVAPSGVRRVA